MVLLKNDSAVLPLKTTDRIALVGPFTSMKNDLMGSWTMKGVADEVVSVFDGFKNKCSEKQILNLGCAWNGVTPEYLSSLPNRVKDASVIVACIGEYVYNIGEAVSTAKLEIPKEQIDMLRRLKATGKPVVAVLFNGRPLVLDQVLASCDALLEAWYPGTMGGAAVADLLLGEQVPSGKLTQTFPRHAGQVPISYNMRRTFGRIDHNDIPRGPQFPFGFGLSYTTFEYSEPETDQKTYRPGDPVMVRVTVRNTGKVAAREVVQLYIRDEQATIVPREKELRGFASVVLKPGEEQLVTFTLTEKDFMIYNNQMKWVLEPGRFKILTGSHSEDLKETMIEISDGKSAK